MRAGPADFPMDFPTGRRGGAEGPPGPPAGVRAPADGRRAGARAGRRKSVGRFGGLGVCKGMQGPSPTNSPPRHAGGGPAASPRGGRAPAVGQDELGLRGCTRGPGALPASWTTHTLHARNARRLARRAAAAVAAEAADSRTRIGTSSWLPTTSATARAALLASTVRGLLAACKPVGCRNAPAPARVAPRSPGGCSSHRRA
jgi:hypothetical protein